MVIRMFVERNSAFDNTALFAAKDLSENLNISIKGLRLLYCYDIEGISEAEAEKCRYTVFADEKLDKVYDEGYESELTKSGDVLTYRSLPGQFDSRADSAEWAVRAATGQFDARVVFSLVYAFDGTVPQDELKAIRKFLINPVESVELPFVKPRTIIDSFPPAPDIEVIDGFIGFDEEGLKRLRNQMGLSMSLDDLKLIYDYFAGEQRNPTVTEIKVLDTYWSDHCRHSTFMTEITDVTFMKSRYKAAMEKAYALYKAEREELYGADSGRGESLMDIAVMGMKALKAKGLLNDLDESEEVNACSIETDVDVNGKNEKWLFMFKNETHNHPTEIEPFGGASTCLGGGIRDPLSGRSLVYQAMRITGAGDPRTPVSKTIPGKLPQISITRSAAKGYSSYGNQIGAASGLIREIYDPGFVAKRMELGALVSAAPKENVVRLTPEKTDVVILVGGETGRDGCGGATGSSKGHTEDSSVLSGAEVQKGNPPLERDIQRLFVNPEAARLIKRCNDFGAGGVSVAVVEMADGILIDLDKVPVKYDGLSGTEIAIAESQERMAVVIAKKDAARFIELANAENADATIIAEVTDDNMVTMKWRGKTIVSLSRNLLNMNGAKRTTGVAVGAYESVAAGNDNAVSMEKWLSTLKDLNVCSQKGLVEQFDASVGGNTVLMPYGGKYAMTPAMCMASKFPVVGETNTASLMAYGYNPDISKKSPFHGAAYAVVESVANIVASGGDYKKARLTFQEYFESLFDDKTKWGKPFSALLGAFDAQMGLKIPSVGGKDSMSGTFNDLNVPPTLVSFAVCVTKADNIISPEFKGTGSKIVVVNATMNADDMPRYDVLMKNFDVVQGLIAAKKVVSASTITFGGLCAALSKMAFGNGVAFEVGADMDLYTPRAGSIVLEYVGGDVAADFEGADYTVIGETIPGGTCVMNKQSAGLETLTEAFVSTLEPIFPSGYGVKSGEAPPEIRYSVERAPKQCGLTAKPAVLIPVFPGTNGERDLNLAFTYAGADSSLFVIRNRTAEGYMESIKNLAESVKRAQILVIPGGGYGDEPARSGAYIASVLGEPRVMEAIAGLLTKGGLILGIDAGFSALVKSGLLPGGVSIAANACASYVSRIVNTVVVSVKSPWLCKTNVGDVFAVPAASGEGRVVIDNTCSLAANGGVHIATQFCDESGIPSMDAEYNPFGSTFAIEGITSEDGRIFGKTCHSERFGRHTYKNVPGNYDMKIFESGVKYFS